MKSFVVASEGPLGHPVSGGGKGRGRARGRRQ